MGQLMGADFSGVRVHTEAASDMMCRSIQATAFTAGQDLYFTERAYEPRTTAGQQLIAHELTHVVQQGGPQLRREGESSGVEISSTPGDRLQRKFGFEIELPVLLTEEADSSVTSQAGGPDIMMPDLPQDPGLRGHETNLIDGNSGECYINADHNQAMNPLFRAHLDQYSTDQNHDANERASLKAVTGELMPSKTSIAEVVTNPFDEKNLNRDQARAKIKSVINDIEGLFDAIAGDQKLSAGNYALGSTAPNADLFQPRLGYFHATYGVKLSQIPRLFEQTTQQKKSLAKYAKRNVPEKEHAQNLELTSRAVPAAKAAMKEIKSVWPRQQKTRKYLPDTTEIAMSPAAEKDFLGLITLVGNYLLMMTTKTGGGDLAKKLLGMHYYKSDLYDVVTNLSPEVRDRLRDADRTLMNQVVLAICDAFSLDPSAPLSGGGAGYQVKEYLYQIFRGHGGLIQDPDTGGDKLDSANQTFMDPVLGRSINPWSKKLGPEQLGPTSNQELGVVLENRHLEYLDPRYGDLLDKSEQASKDDYARFANLPADQATPVTRAMIESVGARDQGPARRPLGEWEGMMMNIYDMVKALNR
jgi:hypothetical protein